MKAIALAEIRANFEQYLDLAKTQPIAIVDQGKPVGFLIGLLDPDNWWEECLLRHPKFLSHVAEQRRQLRSGQGKTLEEIRARYE